MPESVFIPKSGAASGSLIGWCHVDNVGAILAQSASAPVQSVAHPGNGLYDFTLKAGLPALEAVIGQGSEAGFGISTTATVTSPTIGRVEAWDIATDVQANLSVVAFFYST